MAWARVIPRHPVLIAIASGIGVFLAAGLLGPAFGGRWRRCSDLVYVLCGGASAVVAAAAAWHLIGAPDQAPLTAVFPFGLPWMQAHFRVDALSGYFLVVANVIGGAVSLFAIGYGRHE